MGKKLNDQYWSERYQSNQIGWDIGQASTPIATYIDQIEDKSIKILIPGCGNAHEARYLLDLGFEHVTLIDISKVLVDKLKIELQAEVEKGRCSILHGDFFDLKGGFDLIIEQTFFCALDPSLRIKYVDKMHELLNPAGKLVGVLFDFNFEGGPPFGGSIKEYEELFKPKFEIKNLEPCYNSIGPRQGKEVFVHLVNKNI